MFKSLTLAFFTYQVVYWAWLTLETEEIKDRTNQEIKSLESEVRLLDASRRAQRTSDPRSKSEVDKGTPLLEEGE